MKNKIEYSQRDIFNHYVVNVSFFRFSFFSCNLSYFFNKNNIFEQHVHLLTMGDGKKKGE